MTKENQAAFDKAKQMARAGRDNKSIGKAIDYLYENYKGPEEELQDNPSVAFFEGECFEKMHDYCMAMECYKNAYLSSLARNIQQIQ